MNVAAWMWQRGCGSVRVCGCGCVDVDVAAWIGHVAVCMSYEGA